MCSHNRQTCGSHLIRAPSWHANTHWLLYLVSLAVLLLFQALYMRGRMVVFAIFFFSQLFSRVSLHAVTIDSRAPAATRRERSHNVRLIAIHYNRKKARGPGVQKCVDRCISRAPAVSWTFCFDIASSVVQVYLHTSWLVDRLITSYTNSRSLDLHPVWDLLMVPALINARNEL